LKLIRVLPTIQIQVVLGGTAKTTGTAVATRLNGKEPSNPGVAPPVRVPLIVTLLSVVFPSLVILLVLSYTSVTPTLLSYVLVFSVISPLWIWILLV